MTNIEDTHRRAGFWRRFAAFIIDFLIVLVPLQIAVAILFAMTNGSIQGSFGIVSRVCQPLAQAPAGLVPPPPADANTATECESSFFGLPTSRDLTIGTVQQEGNTTTGLYYTYSLDGDGKPNNAVQTDWIAILALLAYLIAMEHRTGATIGKRALGLRAVPTHAPSQIGLSLKQAAIRNFAQFIGMVPALLVLFIFLFVAMDPLTAMESSSFWTLFTIAIIIQLAWVIWIIVSVSNKRDPIYDRIAGTSVLRTR